MRGYDLFDFNSIFVVKMTAVLSRKSSQEKDDFILRLPTHHLFSFDKIFLKSNHESGKYYLRTRELRVSLNSTREDRSVTIDY